MKRLIFAVALLLMAFPVFAQDAASRQALSQARQSYYNLPNAGMAAFQCDLTPNWNALLEDARKQNPEAGEAAQKVLNQLHFVLSFAADGDVKITHNDLTGQNAEMQTALAQIYTGMEQMTSGFFETWKMFVYSSPFPEANSTFNLDPAGSQYHLTYKEGTADVVTVMDKDFVISSVIVTAPTFTSTIQPKFLKTPKGLLLSSYNATYGNGKPEETTLLNVQIGYQEVSGLQMIQKLDLTGSYGGTPFAVQVALSGHQVTKKNQ